MRPTRVTGRTYVGYHSSCRPLSKTLWADMLNVSCRHLRAVLDSTDDTTLTPRPDATWPKLLTWSDLWPETCTYHQLGGCKAADHRSLGKVRAQRSSVCGGMAGLRWVVWLMTASSSMRERERERERELVMLSWWISSRVRTSYNDQPTHWGVTWSNTWHPPSLNAQTHTPIELLPTNLFCSVLQPSLIRGLDTPWTYTFSRPLPFW